MIKLLSIILSTTILFSSSFENRLISQANKDNKLIMIEVTSKYCYYCKKMDIDVFKDKEVSLLLNKYYVFDKIFIDREKLPFNLDKDFSGMTPTFFILTKDGEALKQIRGSWSKSDFIDILKNNTQLEKDEFD
ncbi:MAG: DUF255 domain-containing protein [Campylobacterota bacterium]|nr:DUF255 domain-containing protein [Campylobacterota bacterium]